MTTFNYPPPPEPKPSTPASGEPQFGPTQLNDSGKLRDNSLVRGIARSGAIELGDQLWSHLGGMNDADETELHIQQLKKEGIIGNEPHQLPEDEVRQFMLAGGYDKNKNAVEWTLDNTGLANDAAAAALDKAGRTGMGNLVTLGYALGAPPAQHHGMPRWLMNTVNPWRIFTNPEGGNGPNGSYGGREDIMNDLSQAVRNYYSTVQHSYSNAKKRGPAYYADFEALVGKQIPLSEYLQPRDKDMPWYKKPINSPKRPMTKEEYDVMKRLP